MHSKTVSVPVSVEEKMCSVFGGCCVLLTERQADREESSVRT